MVNPKKAVVLTNIKKSYVNKVGGKQQLVLNGVSIEANKGEVTVLMGQSGCGKSTLFRILIGEEVADEGRVEILQNNVTKVYPQNVKRKFGILFQSGALFNSMTVGDNIAFPILEHQPQLHKNIVNIMVDTKLRQVDLEPEIYKDKMPSTLSGGESKRASLARALALDPQLIFYDEPSAGLDPIVSRRIDALIRDLVRVLGISSVVITHELDSAFAVADKMIILKRAIPGEDDWKGTIVYEKGTPEELKASQKPYTVDFLGDFSDYRICSGCGQVIPKRIGCSTCHSQEEMGTGAGTGK